MVLAMSHSTVLPGPMVLRHAPAAWRRCPELGCGEAGGHAGAHVPEAVPPLPLPPPMPREERTTDAPPAAPCVVCGAREHLAIDCPCFVPRGDRVRAVAAPPSPVVDQPPPAPSRGPAIWDLVVDDMIARDHVGRARYGTPLRAGNGRDALVDAYQEALDLVVYLRQAIEERGR